MRYLTAALTLIALSSIAHASEAVRLKNTKEPLQKPAGCLKAALDKPCALQTDSDEKLVLDLAGGKVILDEVTTVVRESASEVRLVAGTVWVQPKEKSDSLLIRTEFGYAKSSSDFWVGRTEDRMTVSAMSCDVEMHPRGTSEVLLVAPGIENFMGRVDVAGRATTGFPVPIAPRTHLDRWARLSTNSKKEFEGEVAEFKERWVQGVEEASNVQQTLFERKVASIDEARAQKAQARQKVEAHNRELRDLFRKKYSGGE